MTLVTAPDCFSTYNSPAVCDQVRATLRSLKYSSIRLLTLLEAYLELTGQQLHAQNRNSALWESAARGFIGALHSRTFAELGATTRYNHSRLFLSAVSILDPQFTPPLVRLTRATPASIQALAEAFENTTLDGERRIFWAGWTISNRRGKPSYLELHAVHERYGTEFCARLHKALQQWYSQTVLDGPIGIKSLVSHLSKQPLSVGADHFQDPVWMTHFTRDLFVSFFKESHANSNAMRVAKRQWAELARTLERHILGIIWSTPDAPIPIPPAPRVPERLLRVKMSKDGCEYKSKMLTDIPLSIRDREAKQAIYDRFKRDIYAVECWAKERCDRAIKGQRLRESITADMRADPQPRILDRLPKNFTHREAIEATAERFEARAMPLIYAPKSKVVNGRLASDALGIATPMDLLAYSAVLILSHPAITPAFLQELEIVDAHGRPLGIIDIDGSTYLVGMKRRRGSNLAEQRIRLNEKTEQIVQDIIQVTSTQRAILKAEGNDHWRRLLLQCTSPHRPVSVFDAVKHANYLTPRLAQEFRLHCESEEHAMQLATRFSLSSLRSSVGTLVYLETGSPHAMSRALGHDAYSPRLLDHYLPRVMREFFEERWIRTVQTSVICQALVGSDLQLPASGFKTIQELEEFMRLHAFEVALHQAENGDNITNVSGISETPGKMLFNVEQQVVAALISLQLAVDAAPDSFCDRAHWWANLYRKIRPELEDRPDLAPILAKALAMVDPAIVEGLAYA